MSDDNNSGQEDETRKGAAPNNEKTVMRGNKASSSEANDDATRLRKPEQEPNNDATVLRGPTKEVNNDTTILRSESSDGTDDATETRAGSSLPNDEATVLRPKQNRENNDEETVVRSERKERKSERRPPASRSDDGGGDATILREPSRSADGDSATILRPPSESSSATILREPGEDGATILRSGDDGDSTILRAGDDPGDDDRTIINEEFDDDSTVIGSGGGKQDTTYIASVGKQQRPRGNTEAGRLLKNRFVLEERIGSGGMGDVYKALDLRQQEAQESDPYIAIKLLNENFARHKDAFLSLQRETSRTRGIPHPNIMAVYDFDREGDTVFMSMELLDGKPLDDYLKEHPEGVSVDDAWIIIDGISQGLMRAHGAGIVHSDFKPGNIFYTKDKQAKVFDFGIARAVSNPNDLEADGEKTVFDAGSLGALTPTYASYEMLKGMEPSKSDDVYAVALVAYELFMGKHPYDRVPADKAYERGLKPKPVPFLKRRHWKALKKALELRGEDRTQTIDEFYEGVFSEDPPYFRYAAVATVLIASLGFGVYQATNVVEKPGELLEWENMMSAANLTTQSITNNPRWESQVWHEQMSDAMTRWRYANQQILENKEWVEEWDLAHDDRIEKQMEVILNAYMAEITRLTGDAQAYDKVRLEQYGVDQALVLLESAQSLMGRVIEHYKTADPTRVDQENSRLDVALTLRRNQRDSEDARVAREEAEEAARIEATRVAEEKRVFEENRLNQYNRYLAELTEILKCKGNMPEDDLDRLGVLLPSMKAEWQEAYDHHYPTIVNYLSSCIGRRIGLVQPEHAREIKSRVVTYLPGESEIAGIVIEDKDPCDDRKLIGRGNRNQRWCTDTLYGSGSAGPELVVIPPVTVSKQDYKYAISRAEIKVGEYNLFCQSTGCSTFSNIPASWPVTNVSVQEAQAYAAWLSEQSGQTYRLPTEEEWLHAVKTNETYEMDENINCTVDSRGVRLGEKLLNVVSGKCNKWGLYNFVGNAREWAYNEENELVALGGAHTDPRNECRIDKRVVHEGQADPVTGFRVIREIENKDERSENTELAASG